MNYYLAPSLAALRSEINARWPKRDKASDGWIGDPSHSARKSDHNPDYDAGGVVRALDIDKDGVDMAQIIAAAYRDPRVAYIIWQGRIASATDDGTPWDWEPYSGSNPHDKHIHISIKHTRAAETDTSAWLDKQQRPTEEDDMFTQDDRDDLTFVRKRLAGITHDPPRRVMTDKGIRPEKLLGERDGASIVAQIARLLDPKVFAAAVVAELPKGSTDEAAVERAVRKVFADAGEE